MHLTLTRTPAQAHQMADHPIDPLDPSLLIVSTSSNSGLAVPVPARAQAEPSLQSLPISSISLKSPSSQPSSPSNRKRLSFKRTSINFANLILGHSNHHHSPLSPNANRRSYQLPLSPSSKSPLLLDQLQPSSPPDVSRACPVCNLPIPFHAQLDPSCAHCPTCATLSDFPPPSSSPAPVPNDPVPFTIDDDDVARLASLALSPADLARFDASPSAFLQSAPPPLRDQITAFHALSSQLVSGLFGSLSALSTAFLAPHPRPLPTSPRSLRLALVKPFFAALVAGPGGLALLVARLNGFLARPGSELAAIKRTLDTGPPTAQAEIGMWAWAAVLFECPVLLPTSTIPCHQRLIMTARLLGIISSLPNQIHHHLVQLYSHKLYPNELFEEKVELVNVFIGERIRFFLGISGGGGDLGEDGGRLGEGYMKDWAIVGASRVMSLLFSANTISSKLPITAFYNISTDLISPTDLITDFSAWETRQRGCYTLTGYPFLLSIGSKMKLLTHEGRRQMGFEARQAAVDRLLLGQSGFLGSHEPVLQICVRRNRLVEDSVLAIGRAEREGTVRKLLKIRFVGEEGVDGGGLKKEWFLLLIRELVSPAYGMFTIDSDSGQIWFNPASSTTLKGSGSTKTKGSLQDEEFRLVGTVLGLAIYNRVSLDVELPLVCFKKLLSAYNSPTNKNNQNMKNDRGRYYLKTSNVSTSKLLGELKSFKPGLAKGLEWMVGFEGGEEEFEEVFCGRRWVAEVEGWDGQVVEVPLCGGEMGDGEEEGADRLVTLENRQAFVRRYCEFIINDSIEAQFKAFAEGFSAVASGNALSLLTPTELSLILRGSPDPLDITALRSTTTYSGGYSSSSVPVVLFWRVLEERMRSGEERAKVLRFVTGSDRVPVCGSGAIGMRICRVGVASGGVGSGKRRRLPESHTCFNQLNLPDDFDEGENGGGNDEALDEMERRVRMAVEESEGFGLN